MFKKDNLYYPNKEFKEIALVNDQKIYQEAAENPIKFWENLAEKLSWYKKWDKAFEHNPPYFKWFVNGKINITSNIFEESPQNWQEIKNKTALIWQPESIKEKKKVFTYQELLDETNKLANGLKRIGVKKGDRVGIYLPMIPEIIISMLACARIGAIHTVVFSAFSAHALQIRLQDTEAKVLITVDGYYRRGKTVNLKEQADQAVQETKVEKKIIVKRANNQIDWNEKTDLWFDEIIKQESNQCQAEIMDSEDVLFILYTSGSTGKPKGIVHSCGGYTVQAYWTGQWIFDLKKDDILWCTSDAGWVTGHTYTIYAPLLNSVPTLLFEGAPDWPEPDRWAQIIKENKITTFYTAPTAIRMFEKYGKKQIEKYNFETLQLLGSVGEPIDQSAWLWYFENVGKEKCPLVDTWWQTETGGILITSLPGIGPFKPAFSGLPFPGISFDILDEKGKSCLINQQGNLVILPPFAPGLLRNVYKNPVKYQETYWQTYGDKIYFTSDAAYKDENNLIRIIGRVDDVIKVAGHRLSTGELEAAVNLHPDITECAAIGIADEIKGETPIIFIIYKGKKEIDEIKQEIIQSIRKEIGPIASPKEIYLVEDLPKTRSGKIMRRILKKLFTNEDLGDLSTLANPETVENLKKIINEKQEK